MFSFRRPLSKLVRRSLVLPLAVAAAPVHAGAAAEAPVAVPFVPTPCSRQDRAPLQEVRTQILDDACGQAYADASEQDRSFCLEKWREMQEVTDEDFSNEKEAEAKKVCDERGARLAGVEPCARAFAQLLAAERRGFGLSDISTVVYVDRVCGLERLCLDEVN